MIFSIDFILMFFLCLLITQFIYETLRVTFEPTRVTFLFPLLVPYHPQGCTVRSILTTATRSSTQSPKSQSASTTASAWIELEATTASAPRGMSGSAARETSTSVCPTPVTRGAHTAASSSPTTTAANVALDTQVNVLFTKFSVEICSVFLNLCP